MNQQLKKLVISLFLCSVAFGQIIEVKSNKTFTEQIGHAKVTIGNDKVSTEFQAQAKMRFWDEDDIWLEMPNAKGIPTLANDKISLDLPTVKYDWFKDGDSLKWLFILKSKPLKNSYSLKLGGNWQDFNFWKQEVWPAPVETFYENGEEWQRKYNYNDWNVVQRARKVEGSYSVRHKTKRGDYVGGKQYKTGKAMHIYTPKATDAIGKTEWADLDITNGVYTVTISQKFLDTAIYPVIVNDVFGSIYAGATNGTHNGGQCRVAGPYSPTFNGNATSITINFNHTTENVDFITGIYADNTGIDGGALLKDGAGETISADGEHVFNLDSALAVLSANSYWLAWNKNGNNILGLYYDAGGQTGAYDTVAYSATAVGANPYAKTGDLANYEVDIFCTYTPSGGAPTGQVIMINMN